MANDAEPVCVVRGHNYELDSEFIDSTETVATSTCTLCGGTTTETS